MSQVGNEKTPHPDRLQRYGLFATIAAALFAGGSAYVAWSQNSALILDREEQIKRSSYTLTVLQETLILSAVDDTILPSKVTVTPIFEMPPNRLAEGEGAVAPAYENLQAQDHKDGVGISIPDIKTDVCGVVENRDRCRQFPISDFRVVYSFGPYGALSEYVPLVSPGPRS